MRDRDTDIDEEMREHVRRLTEANVARGMSVVDARRAALLSFGSVEALSLESHEQRRWAWLEDLGSDLRYAARLARQSPGFTAIALLTLALGIGANAAIFSIADALLLRPLPYADPDALIAVQSGSRADGKGTLSYPDYIDVRDQAHSFQGTVAYRLSRLTLSGQGEPEFLQGIATTAGLFDLLGVRPVLGRGFLPGEDAPGAARTVVLSYGLWQRRFRADPDVVGQTILLDGEPVQVVGVAPATFQFPLTGPPTNFWTPLGGPTDESGRRWRSITNYEVVARLKPGARLDSVQAELGAIGARLAKAYPTDDGGHALRAFTLANHWLGDVRAPLLLLLGTVAFVLLIAAANIANLQLSRAARRTAELAMRAALGARRTRLVRQLLAESLLLALAGGALGIGLAHGLLKLLLVLIPQHIPRPHAIALDGRTLAYALLLIVLSAALVGIAPALEATRRAPADLRPAGRTVTGRGRMQRLLLVGEIAMAIVLLVGAGLLVRSYRRVTEIDPGFDSRALLTARIIVPKAVPNAVFYKQLLAALDTLPGRPATAVTAPLLYSRTWYGALIYHLDDRPPPPPTSPWWINNTGVSPGYFHTMGIALLRGRAFEPGDDDAKAPQVAIVNEAFVRRHFPEGGDPIGKHILAYSQYALRIIGVVADTRGFCGRLDCAGDNGGRLDRPAAPEFYSPFARGASPSQYVVIRAPAGTDPLALAAPLRALVRSIHKDAIVREVQTMDSAIADSLGSRRITVWLMTFFAVVALLLTAVGIFGVVSYVVSRRTREVAIRMAVGAAPAGVLRMIVWDGLRLGLVGVGIGVTGALVLTRLLSGLLYEVRPADPLTFTGTALLALVVCAFASYVPGRRATQLDPMEALRHE